MQVYETEQEYTHELNERLRMETGWRDVSSGLAMVLWGYLVFFLGTVIGHSWTSQNLSILFFTLAAGSILYVVIELLNVCRTFSSKSLTAWGIVLGLTLGFATDFILVAAGV